MMKYLTLLVLLGPLFHWSLIAAIPIQRGQIAINENTSLKDVFDGGLRPYRMSVAKNTCSTLGAELEVIFPTQNRVQMSLRMTDFTVLIDNKINRIELVGSYLDLENAHAKTKEICGALGINADGLDEIVQKTTRQNASISTWAGNWKSDQHSVRVGFEPIVFKERIAATVFVLSIGSAPCKKPSHGGNL